MAQENKEEYLEAIYELTEEETSAKTSDIANHMNVKPASVTEMLGKLSKEGFVAHTPYHGVTLTKKGKKHARKMKRKHRLIERFLHDVLGIKKKNIHDEACRLEHGLSDESEKALDKLLGHPETCPDGNKIPR